MATQTTGLYGFSSGVWSTEGDECLDPSTNWDATELDSSTVIITDWDTVGHINRGAYSD
jgi:hypothetical protein